MTYTFAQYAEYCQACQHWQTAYTAAQAALRKAEEMRLPTQHEAYAAMIRIGNSRPRLAD
jgi:hypothetical protein